MKKNLFKSFLSLILLLGSTGLMAQTVNGTVSSEDGPLPGATVQVQGTDRGVSTDFDGNFSIEAGADDVLVVSFVGFSTQNVAVSGQDQLSVMLMADNELEEVVITGYGSQRQKEVTSAVVQIEAEGFNKGAINDPTQLLQGKVAGLQIYNKGGDPNSSSVIRLRGISTVGANTQPLVVIDGVIGASLGNVDPNDIESINVLKDGSASAIYGSRGSSGVIIVTTKEGKAGTTTFNYNGQFALASRFNSVDIMTPGEFTAAGGADLGSETIWLDEITRSAATQIHNLSASGGSDSATYRVSANVRQVEGILKNSGFDQFNTRLNYSTRLFNDKLRLDFNTSVTKKDAQNGIPQALRYAIVANPTMPIYGADSPYQFNAEQFGGYFESLGLFDSFNPVSMVEQNRNDGENIDFNYNISFNLSLTDDLSISGNAAEQNSKFSNVIYYPTTSHFNGNATSPLRKGLAEFYDQKTSFKLYELFGTLDKSFGSTDMTLTAGYSYQQQNFESKFLSLGDFPNNDLDFSQAIENSQDLLNAGLIAANSDASPDDKIIAFFGRVNLTFDNAIFVNASVRQEGSTKLGEDNRWGLFPAVGLGVDLNNYLELSNVELLKVRVGYGVTGALPGPNGLSQQGRALAYDGGQGGAGTTLTRAANPDLKWEEKAETNFGVEFQTGRFGATLDLYTRDIKDFILQRTVDVAEFGVDSRFENAGELKTSGLELAIDYDVVDNGNVSYNTGINFSTYTTELVDYVLEAEMRGPLGAPGQNSTLMIRNAVGEEVGQIWGPRYTGQTGGNPDFADINGDGQVIANQDAALDENVDMEVLGSGIPDFELGWSNQIEFGDWSVNAFFRGAFGHSLVNTFRAFYEPRLSTQTSYNFVNTELADPNLTSARFSSLYVEKADFFKLDNLTIARNIDVSGINGIDALSVQLTGQNLFVLTNYTGSDPEPSLVDRGASDNGGIARGSDVLAPGIDRRYNYFNSRTFTLGVNLKF